jgi:hypothetical protein
MKLRTMLGSSRCVRLIALAISLAASMSADAQLIDFESTPAGPPPTDELLLAPTSPYVFGPLQIRFGIDSNNDNILEDTVFEEAGTFAGEGTNVGFSGSHGFDTADPGFGGVLKQFFLRSANPGSDFGKFIITYTGATVTAASGEIWDIDGTAQVEGGPGFTEQYTVTAYDSANNLLATDVSPTGTLTSAIAPYDGQPWKFVFSGLTAGIARIEIDFTGTKPGGAGGGIGLAFDNFYPTSVPEPAGITLVLVALCGLTIRRCRRDLV